MQAGYNYANSGMMGQQSGASQATSGANMQSMGPYIQMALAAAQAMGSDSGTQEIADKFESAYGRGAKMPSQPSSQSKGQRATRAGGQVALNFVPVAGPFLSMAGGAYNSDVDAKAKQDYIKKLMAANPDIVDPKQMGIESTYQPQQNSLGRWAQSQGPIHKFMSGGPEGEGHFLPFLDKLGSKTVAGRGLMIADPGAGAATWASRKIGHAITGAEDKQKKKSEAIAKKNKMAAAAYGSKKRNQQIQQQAGQAQDMGGGPGGMPPQIMAYLQQMLGGQMGQMGQQMGQGRPQPQPMGQQRRQEF